MRGKNNADHECARSPLPLCPVKVIIVERMCAGDATETRGRNEKFIDRISRRRFFFLMCPRKEKLASPPYDDEADVRHQRVFVYIQV